MRPLPQIKFPLGDRICECAHPETQRVRAGQNLYLMICLRDQHLGGDARRTSLRDTCCVGARGVELGT
jgi:hypothetical protein